MAHIRKFNENVVPSQLNEGSMAMQEIKNRIDDGIAGVIYNYSSDLEDYTINESGQLKLMDTVTTEYGIYDYVITITRTS